MIQNEIKEIWTDLNEELYGFILLKVGDKEMAKDILQEVFIKVQTNFHKLKHTAKLTAWVYQITRNTIIDQYRKTKRKNIPVEGYELPETDDDSFEYAKLSDCINGKIAQLSKKHKEVIVLTYLKDFSQKELAEHLKLSYSGTKSRVQKARTNLKDDILNCPNVASDNSGKIIDFNKK